MTSSQPEGKTANAFQDSHPMPLEPMDPQIKSIQPGGGACMRIELWWVLWRRWYLKTCCPGYVARMREARRGDTMGCPHEVLDPRDLKYYRNVCDCRWPAEADSFRWRDRLPFARAGLAELVLFVSGFGLVAL